MPQAPHTRVTVGFDDHGEADTSYTYRDDRTRAEAEDAALERFAETWDTQGEIARTIVKRVERGSADLGWRTVFAA